MTSEPIVGFSSGDTTTVMLRQEPECHGHHMQQQIDAAPTCAVTPHTAVQTEESEEVKTQRMLRVTCQITSNLYAFHRKIQRVVCVTGICSQGCSLVSILPLEHSSPVSHTKRIRRIRRLGWQTRRFCYGCHDSRLNK